jgi:DNA-binding NarL/FixJ family response regulator
MAAEQPPESARVRVLVVDDDESFAEWLAALLGLEHELDVVAWAANGLQALESVDAHRPDVVLMDILMPRMDGLEATKIIRRRYPQTAVVLMSGALFNDIGEAAAEAGADGYVPKSDLASALPDVVRSVVALTRA